LAQGTRFDEDALSGIPADEAADGAAIGLQVGPAGIRFRAAQHPIPCAHQLERKGVEA
jgi:hypothetical protein